MLCWISNAYKCVWCACNPSVSRCSFHRCCLCLCVMEVISSFRSLRAGSQGFDPLTFLLCVIMHTMWLSM